MNWTGRTGICIPKVHVRSQQISKGSWNVVVRIERVQVWKDVVIRYDGNGESYDVIFFRIAVSYIVAMHFMLQTSWVLQFDVRYDGSPGNGFGGLLAVNAVLHGLVNCELEKRMKKKDGKEEWRQRKNGGKGWRGRIYGKVSGKLSKGKIKRNYIKET